jgi:hypothetical protein
VSERSLPPDRKQGRASLLWNAQTIFAGAILMRRPIPLLALTALSIQTAFALQSRFEYSVEGPVVFDNGEKAPGVNVCAWRTFFYSK